MQLSWYKKARPVTRPTNLLLFLPFLQTGARRGRADVKLGHSKERPLVPLFSICGKPLRALRRDSGSAVRDSLPPKSRQSALARQKQGGRLLTQTGPQGPVEGHDRLAVTWLRSPPALARQKAGRAFAYANRAGRLRTIHGPHFSSIPAHAVTGPRSKPRPSPAKSRAGVCYAT